METTVWTVSTHDSQVESNGVARVFSTRLEATQYLTSIVIMAMDRGYDISRTEDSYWTITLEFYKDSNLISVSTMRGQRLISLKNNF